MLEEFHAPPAQEFGEILRYWRRQRRFSQLQLSSEISVSSRHLSFLETGRAKPSRAMVLQLATYLGIPKKETNQALLSAGLAPEFISLPAEHAALGPVFSAIDRLLENHSPFPAIVLDASWNLTRANLAALALLTDMGYESETNMIQAIINDNPSTSAIVNWDETVGALHGRLASDVAADPTDETLASLVQELEDRHVNRISQPQPSLSSQAVLTTRLRIGDTELAFFSVFVGFGTVRELSAAGLSAELMFPVDSATEAYVRSRHG